MLPPASMLVIKKCGLSKLMVLLAAGLITICGCTPPGPRALLKGEKLIQQGKYSQAVEQLEKAARLLPKNAQAWNHLGLAYHGNQEPAQAIKAYRQALALDHKLALVRYNLGCLLLEENDLPGALEQLTSYTLVEPRSVEGQLKLGTVQLRLRRLDLADRTFRTVLELQPRHPEAFNGLGLVYLQRRRPLDALICFNQTSNHPPALLNSAVVLHQYMNNRAAALQKYRQYAALQPPPPDLSAVSALITQLDHELNPPPPPPLQLTPVVARTNAPPLVHTDAVPKVVVTSAPPQVAVAPVRSNNITANLVKPATPVSTSNPPLPSPVVVKTPTPPLAVVKTSAPPAVVHTPVPTNKPAVLELTHVSEELVIKPPQDVSAGPPVVSRQDGKETAVATPNFADSQDTSSKIEKRGILSRLNPFTTRTKPDSPSLVVAVASNRVTEIKSSETNSTILLPPPPTVPAVFPRYTYLSPARPAGGQRPEAERYFLKGVKAQQARNWNMALTEYQQALQADPAYFEAFYNRGLVAYELGNWKLALESFEYALAIQPLSVDSRYNLALAMKQANYLVDAAAECERIVQAHPDEARAHYSLANLYAEKLNQPALARDHYRRVLDLDPRHPKASEIRYWLAAHP